MPENPEQEQSVDTIRWTENHAAQSALWHSENQTPVPERIELVDDDTKADVAYRMAKGGTTLLWRGDDHNARQLLKALDRRWQRHHDRKQRGKTITFASHRRDRADRSRLLARLIVELDENLDLVLRRAPATREACLAAFGPLTGPMCVSLTELTGVLSAYQWQQNGVPIAALDGRRVHPRYGVFSPVRGEYIELVAEATLPTCVHTAFDLGTGTGVLAAVLAGRGIAEVKATDINPRAVDCARENMGRLGYRDAVEVVEADLFPTGRADLVVCNPPWLPAQPSSWLEAGIYDPDSDMLRRFLEGLAAHLNPEGEGWLVISDLAEHLGLRTREELLKDIAAAGLDVVGRLDTEPKHSRARDARDELHAARSREITSLWRLRVSEHSSGSAS